MSICVLSKASAGILSAAGVMAVADPNPIIQGYEKLGVIGVLAVIVGILYWDGKKEAAKAEARREAREKREDALQSQFISAINDLKTALERNAAKCDATRELIRDSHKG